MKTYHNILMDLIEDYQKEHPEISISRIVEDCLPEISKILYDSLLKSSARMLEEHRLLQSEFEARLSFRWMEPLNLLKTLQVIALESSQEISKELNISDIEEPAKYNVLMSIHNRACRITEEVICLLRGGFADAALLGGELYMNLLF